MSGRQKKEATAKVAAAKAGRRTALPGVKDSAAELEASEGVAAEAESAEPLAKPAPLPRASQAPPPSEPTQRQKTLEAAKEKEIYKALNYSVKKLQEEFKFNPSLREKQQLKEAQKAKGGRRASQEHKPSKTNAQRRYQRYLLKPIIKITTYYHSTQSGRPTA
jgi:hypothetical protein